MRRKCLGRRATAKRHQGRNRAPARGGRDQELNRDERGRGGGDLRRRTQLQAAAVLAGRIMPVPSAVPGRTVVGPVVVVRAAGLGGRATSLSLTGGGTRSAHAERVEYRQVRRNQELYREDESGACHGVNVCLLFPPTSIRF